MKSTSRAEHATKGVTAVDCIPGCREGACGCKSGYLRSNGTCVLSKDCPKSTNCGENEEFYECGAYDQGCNYAAKCDTRCREGSCGCKKGYVRNDERICILRENCQKTPICGENEELRPCGACDGTCKEPNPACTKICRQPECGCKKGYVRSNGKCILLKSCPKTPTCGLHEEIKSCGACDGTCKEPNADCRPPECGCMKEYVRNNGTCILLKSCPKTPPCGPHEEIKGCGACDATCENPHPICPAIYRQPKCGCIKGYVRNNGTCISSDHCLKTPSCGQHEEVKPCGACDGTCKKSHKMCTKDCRPPACDCKKGYVRKNEKCVPQSKCPKKCHK
ncbi:zonadhesin-like isoform X2 [Cotesia typhae]|uniref:zonadhesin-like isoform X2 n=1 Tax=Cotesia typhae TaxID=2053667 RepID=UPI003D68903B